MARLVETAWDCGLVLATTLKEQNPEIRLGDAERQQVRTETATLLVFVVLEIASTVLDFEGLRAFRELLLELVTVLLKSKGEEPSALCDLLQERLVEYAAYPKWVPTNDDSAKDTLFWEFGKKVAAILGVGKNALYQVLLTNLLLESIASWQLRELLKD